MSIFVLISLKYNLKDLVKEEIEVGSCKTVSEGMLEWSRGTLRGVLEE
jgi:hypothetical protein